MVASLLANSGGWESGTASGSRDSGLAETEREAGNESETKEEKIEEASGGQTLIFGLGGLLERPIASKLTGLVSEELPIV